MTFPGSLDDRDAARAVTAAGAEPVQITFADAQSRLRAGGLDAVLSSGDAQNIVANRVLNGDNITSSVTRPLFVGRYTARGPSVYQVDARYTRTLFTLWDRVRPKFIAEANNIFNHPNITTLITPAVLTCAVVFNVVILG